MSGHEWSDARKWVMELVKGLIVFSCVTLAAMLFLNDLEHDREVRHSKEAALLTLRQKTIPDFVQAAVNYETAIYIAYVDLYQWQGTEPTSAMRALETRHFPAYLASAEMIKASFATYPQIIEATRAYMDQIDALFRIYDRVRDRRLDGGAKTPIYPQNERQAFDEARQQAKELRERLLPLIASVVYQEARH